MTSFGPTTAPTYNRVPITFRYLKDEELATQEFQLLAKKMDVNVANRLLSRADSDELAVGELIGLVARYMDNKDGVPLQWMPRQLAPKPDEDPPVKRFRGPDGEIYDWEYAESFLDPEQGSSRRRWLHLMNDDDEASVEDTSLVGLLEFLVELAGKDHTPA